VVASGVDEVPGVGPARRAALLKAFGSVQALREASAEEIAARARVPLTVARRLAEQLAATAAPAGSGARARWERPA
jgi:excinuclease ABC subunit C